MSQHGRGSGPRDDDPDGEEDTEQERASGSSPLPPAARPIAPYDPYRPVTGDRPRLPTRNVAADPFEPPVRPSRATDDDPFLPADDPLSAEAWQLELDEASPRWRRRGDAARIRRRRSSPAAPGAPPAARRCAAVASRHPGRGERPGAADPARRARAAGALVPASRSRCHGSSPDPRSWRTRRRWH